MFQTLALLLDDFIFWLLARARAVACWILKVVRAIWDWVLLRTVAGLAIFLISLRSLFLRRRMSHDNGIAARGRIRLVDDARYPANDFFQPGQEFRARCRFGMVSFWDDARFVARGAALKFDDTLYKSPFDLLMNTGRTTPFWNVKTFVQFMWLTILGRAQHAIGYMKSDPLLYVGSLDPLKRTPESFAQLYYHSKIPYTFHAKDEQARYIKFRMIPWDRGPESDQTDADDRLDWAWCWQGIRPGEKRSRNYLKNELRERLAREPMRFHLELQLHEAREGENPDVLNSCIEWDEKSHPWLPLAVVELDEVLDYKQSNETLITVRNRPACLGFVKARSIHDPAGMNYLREIAIWPRRARLLANRIFGVPKPFPDDRMGKHIHYTPFKDPAPPEPLKPLALPQDEGDALRSRRRETLKLERESYTLTVPGTQPSYVADLPLRERMDSEDQLRMFEDLGGTVADLGLAGIEHLVRRLRGDPLSLSSYDLYYPFRAVPSVSRRWRQDVEFARQRLSGVNPVMIERCTALPAKFPVTDELVAGLLPSGTTLSREIDAGRVYITDYRILDGLKTADARFLAAPICLFHVEPGGVLLPIAIQLEQDPARGPVFTPLDPPWLWLAVKTYVQSADAACHEVSSHLLRTHMVMETVYACARRNLHERHPLMELMAPHFHDTMAINHAARTQLLVPGGALPEVMAAGYDGSIQLLERAFSDWSFERYELPNDLARRGVDGRDAHGEPLLPGYHYRDDGLALLAAIEIWVRDVLTVFYRDDRAIALDYELQDWLRDLADPARGNLKGIPGDGCVETVAELVGFVTHVLFLVSAEHSSVNNGQYDCFGYVPNVPGSMSKAPPTSKQELSEEWLMQALPGPERTSVQIAMVHMLSEPTNHRLGQYPSDYFRGHAAVQRSLHQFQARLDRISAAIRTRNVMLDVPYTYLDPRAVGNSIAI